METSMETNKVELKQIQKISEVVTYLEGLLKGFQAGKIVVQQGDSFVSLMPAEQVEIEVSAKKKKDKEKFCLELSWHGANALCNEPVKITTKEPAGATQAEANSKTAGPKAAAQKSEVKSPAAANVKADDKNKPAPAK